MNALHSIVLCFRDLNNYREKLRENKGERKPTFY